MKHVERLIRRLENATQPFEGLIEGKHAYIKNPNGNYGNKVLVNELVSLELAKLLNITIPNGGLCIINQDTLFDGNLENDLDYDEVIEGVAFYSTRIERTTPFVRDFDVVKLIINKEEINKIILFDHLIYNEDRHEGNLLIQNSKKNGGFVMYAIDHSHVFNLKHAWNEEKLYKLISNEDYKDDAIMKINTDTLYYLFKELGVIKEEILKDEAIKFKDLITKESLDNILAMIPNEWCIKHEDVIALKKYILYRLEHIDDIIELIINYRN